MWYPWAYYGYTPDNVEYNADGTITINNNNGASTGANTALATATPTGGVSPLFSKGVGFGGGAYFECICRWSPVYVGSVTKWPSFWALPIEQDNSVAPYSLDWPGQAAGYRHSLEWDFMEYDGGLSTEYGIAMHDYHGPTGSVVTVNATGISPAIPSGSPDFSQFHKYGALWIPATSTPGSGTAKQFFDDVQIGSTVNWDQNTDATGGVPPVTGAQVCSIIDKLHLFLILGNGSQGKQAMQFVVKEVNVWQVSDANNIHA